MAAPMIWPEFRYHSFLFSTRHVVACAIAMTIPRSHACALQLMVAHFSMFAASIVTRYVGDAQCRTTNGMPYPKTMAACDVDLTKDFYTYAQMFATAMSISGHADLAFAPLLAIQLAPLLMTLVRKHLVGSSTYHVVYSCALAAPLLPMVGASLHDADGLRRAHFSLVCGFIARQLRVRYGFGKHLTWLVAPALGWLVVDATPGYAALANVMVGAAYMSTVVVARLVPFA